MKKEKRPRKKYNGLLKEFFRLSFLEKIEALLKSLETMYTFYAEKEEKRKELIAENDEALKMLKAGNIDLAVKAFKESFDARLKSAKEQGIEAFTYQIRQVEDVILAAFLHQVFADKNLDLANFLKFFKRIQEENVVGDFIFRTCGWWAKVAAAFLADIEQYDKRDVVDLIYRQHRERRVLIEHFIALRKPDSEFKLLQKI